MHFEIKSIMHASFFCTFVYGKCTIYERRDLWNGLSQLQLGSQPWMVGGDFNAILNVSEKRGSLFEIYSGTQ